MSFERPVPVESPWPAVRLGSVLTRTVDTGQQGLPLLSVSATRGVTLRGGDWGDGLRAASNDLSGYLVARPGDVVVNKLVARDGAFGRSPHLGLVSPAYYVLRPATGTDTRFVDYLLHASPYLAEIGRRSKSMPPAQFDISWEMMRSMKVHMPGHDVQERIADYLDRETQRIDELLQKHRRLIALLAEHYESRVSAATQHDGREVQVRRLTALITSGSRGWSALVGDSGAPFVRSANLQRGTVSLRTTNLARVEAPVGAEGTRTKISKGDLFVGITGANTGWVGAANEHVAGGYVSQHVALLRPSNLVDQQWLAFALLSAQVQDQLLESQYGGTKQLLSLEDIASLRVSLPDLETQQGVAAELHRESRSLQTMSGRLERQNELLMERRQALITAAVTGQLDIGEAA